VAQQGSSELTDFVSAQQREFEESAPSDQRKARGQVFTPPAVARFMAAMPELPRRHIRVLDPGAGAGMLTAALCERLSQLRTPRQVELIAFESDERLAEMLRRTLETCQAVLGRRGHTVTYELNAGDFLEAAASGFGGADLFEQASPIGEIDIAIMNPPYAKVRAGSRAAQMLAEVVHGQPNLYALFLAGAAQLLRPDGQLVAITPRSFCNGPYFRTFRRWFFRRMALERIHLFDSRKDTFADVLQESVITHATRTEKRSGFVQVSSSHGRDIPRDVAVEVHPARRIVDDSAGEMILRIPTTKRDASIIDVMDAWPSRFPDHGLGVSTGPVVSFRATEHLLPALRPDDSAPLLTVHNVRSWETRWPVDRPGISQALRVSPESAKLLLPVRNYVLLRRFTAKEENRRLVAGPFLASEWPHPQVGLENHLNYVYHRRRELSDFEVRGLVALFNSRLFDTYFRTVSGNTQVNAAEILSFPFPDMDRIASLGRSAGELTEGRILEFLGVQDDLAQELAAA
jgi:adenine-specific DNA-methyltransferase